MRIVYHKLKLRITFLILEDKIPKKEKRKKKEKKNPSNSKIHDPHNLSFKYFAFYMYLYHRLMQIKVQQLPEFFILCLYKIEILYNGILSFQLCV